MTYHLSYLIIREIGVIRGQTLVASPIEQIRGSKDSYHGFHRYHGSEKIVGINLVRIWVPMTYHLSYLITLVSVLSVVELAFERGFQNARESDSW